MKQKFGWLKKRMLNHLVKKDPLDLRGAWTEYATENDFRFNTDPKKLVAFNAWLAGQVRSGIFIVDPGTPPERPWVSKYVQSAWKTRSISGYLTARASRGELSTTQEEFLRGAFINGELMDTVRLLATRRFEDLKGVTAEMSTQMSRILAQGLIDGKGVLPIAKQMVKEINTLTNERAITIACTELTWVHAEAQLAAYDRLGIPDIRARVEFSTAGDGRVCRICESLNGKILKAEEAHGIIPLHPNCRCGWLPYISVPKKMKVCI